MSAGFCTYQSVHYHIPEACNLYSYKILDSDGGVDTNRGLLEGYIVLVGKLLLTFERLVVPPS
jgi:hypothetical protein